MAGYSRKESISKDIGSGNGRLLTDRAAYISFLEGQLEQVSANSLLTSGFNERIEQTQAQVTTLEEKILNANRLVKLLQQYSEQTSSGQDAYQAKVEEQLASIVSRCDELARKVAILERRPPEKEKIVETHDAVKIGSLEDKLARLEALTEDFARCGGDGISMPDLQPVINVESEVERHVAPLKQSLYLTEQACSRLADDALSAVEKNQRQVQEAKDEMLWGLNELRRDLLILEAKSEKGTPRPQRSSPPDDDLGRQMSARLKSKIEKVEHLEQTLAGQLNSKLSKVEEIEHQLTAQCRDQLNKIEDLERKLTMEFGTQITKVTDLVKRVAKSKQLAKSDGQVDNEQESALSGEPSFQGFAPVTKTTDKTACRNRGQSPGLNPNMPTARSVSRCNSPRVPAHSRTGPRSFSAEAARSRSGSRGASSSGAGSRQRSRTLSLERLDPEKAQRRAQLRARHTLRRGNQTIGGKTGTTTRAAGKATTTTMRVRPKAFALEQHSKFRRAEKLSRRKAIEDLYEELRKLEAEEFGISGPKKGIQ